MYKVIVVLLLSGLVFTKQVGATSITESLYFYENQLENLETQRRNTSDRIELLELTRKENETAKFVRAYRLARKINTQENKIKNKMINATDLPDVVTVGEQWINDSVYAFGGGRNDYEINRGLFDCSSFVHWAFDQVGIELGNRTSVTTDTLKHEGYAVTVDQVEPGDLIFFDTYKIDGHVGIYAGNGMFIGAQGSTGVAYENMTEGYWGDRFNGRVRRIY